MSFAFKAGHQWLLQVVLLASTGRADPATLAERFGIDLHAPAFWQSGFAVLRQEIDRLLALVEDRNA